MSYYIRITVDAETNKHWSNRRLEEIADDLKEWVNATGFDYPEVEIKETTRVTSDMWTDEDDDDD